MSRIGVHGGHDSIPGHLTRDAPTPVTAIGSFGWFHVLPGDQRQQGEGLAGLLVGLDVAQCGQQRGGWSAAQNHIAALSTNSVHRVIDGATHEALIADEQGAAAITQAILDVVSSVRSPGPLVG